jgi:hypothetical protein
MNKRMKLLSAVVTLDFQIKDLDKEIEVKAASLNELAAFTPSAKFLEQQLETLHERKASLLVQRKEVKI